MPISAVSALPRPDTEPITSALSADLAGKQSSRPSAVSPTTFRLLMRALRPFPRLLTQFRAASVSPPPSSSATSAATATGSTRVAMKPSSLPDGGPAPDVGTRAYGLHEPAGLSAVHVAGNPTYSRAEGSGLDPARIPCRNQTKVQARSSAGRPRAHCQ